MNGVTSYRGTTFAERMASAPCRETDADLSFPSTKTKRGDLDARQVAAKKICRRCPLALRQECLEVAMKAEGNGGIYGRYGVFGGLDPQERADLGRERRTA